MHGEGDARLAQRWAAYGKSAYWDPLAAIHHFQGRMNHRSILWLPTGLVAVLCGWPFMDGAASNSPREHTGLTPCLNSSGPDFELGTASREWAMAPNDPHGYNPPAESLNAHPKD